MRPYSQMDQAYYGGMPLFVNGISVATFWDTYGVAFSAISNRLKSFSIQLKLTTR